MSTNMTDKEAATEAKRRNFGYRASFYEVFKKVSNCEKDGRVFESEWEATEYIAHIARTKGVLVAAQYFIRKVIVDNPGLHPHKGMFTQWTKPVKQIDIKTELCFSVSV